LWQTNSGIPNPQPDRGLAYFVIGHFVSDKRADVFFVDGRNISSQTHRYEWDPVGDWWVSEGGTAPFELYVLSGFGREELAFGDFDGLGKTEVAAVLGDQWMFMPSGSRRWTPLRPKLTDSMKGLIAADFDGDGIADLALFSPYPRPPHWQVSLDGRTDFQLAPVGLQEALSHAIALGKFDDRPGTDVLYWHENFWMLGSFFGTPQRQSRQDMR
jgi:hypothetical protein